MDHDAVERSNALASLHGSNSRSRRFPKSSIRILKKWIESNAQNPRPSEVQKRYLQEQTGLTLQQINVWFANARRRASRDKPTIPTMYGLGASHSLSVPNVRRTDSWDSMNPLERWRNSPPDQEPASFNAIAYAVADFNDGTADPRTSYHNEAVSRSSSVPRPLSETSFESLSSFWTTGSSSSLQSCQSEINTTNLDLIPASPSQKRLRRRRSLSKNRSFAKKPQKEGDVRIFQCTFCTDRFKTKYDWIRHEATLHLVLEKWTCTPDGPTYRDPTEGVRQCSLCDETNPTNSHIATHNYTSCSEKLSADRSFRRKDHLRQHLRLIHGVHHPPRSMNQWRTTITHFQSRCGFCGEMFSVWSDRNDHVAEHFRDGKKLKEWKGDRGLVGAICLMVQNAMPPYLIGEESSTLEPFSASRAAPDQSLEAKKESDQPTIFEDLITRLTEFVIFALRDGTTVTDETVKRQARLIIYGDDDAWNQTPADNTEWLRLFKAGLGLGKSRSDPIQKSNTAPSNTLSPTTDTSLITGSQRGVSSDPWSPQSVLQNMNVSQYEQSRLPALSGFSGIPFPTLPLPLNFQTPECLAELMRMHEEGELPAGSDIDLFFGNLARAQAPSGPPDIDDLLAELSAMNAALYTAPENPLGGPVDSHHYHTDSLPLSSFPATDFESGSQWTGLDDMNFPIDLELSPEPGQAANHYKTHPGI